MLGRLHASDPTGQKKAELTALPFFYLVRPAGRAYLEVQVLYTPVRGKC